MSKTKIRCNTCGKWFQSANAKDITCPDCTQKARKEKLAAKNAPPPTTRQPGLGTGTPQRTVPPPPKPKPSVSGTNQWLDSQSDVRIGQPEQPPPRPKLPSSPVSRDTRGTQERGGYRDERGSGQGSGNYREGGGYRGPSNYREGSYRGPGNYRDNDYRTPTPYRVGGGMGLPDTLAPRQPMPPGPGGPPRERGPRPAGPGERGPRPGGKPRGQKKPPKPPAPPKPKREKIPPPEPFKPTEEQIAQVETRYKELAVPSEYDGIRTQIAKEMNIPKSAVKKIIKDLRDREHIPSWWELQTYKGDAEELERIKALYLPFLPVPPIGVHKQIAEQLSLKPADVYQAIKAIRQEMDLPQYNDPSVHGLPPIVPGEHKTETAEAPVPPTSEVEARTEPSETAAVMNAETATPAPTSEVEARTEPSETTAVPVPQAETADVTAHEVSPPTSEATVAVTSEPATPEPVATAASEPATTEATADSPLEESGPHGEVSSIETDTPFHKENGTLEAGATSSTDAPNPTQA